MKNDKMKSFTFKVATQKKASSQWKAREGVAVAGCTMVLMPWGDREPKTNFTGASGDGPVWC